MKYLYHGPTSEFQFDLTENEEQLFGFLLDVEKQYGCEAILRVAGGWVRDKLLGRHSDDVDIVIDTMTGKEFADLINAYEADHGHKKHPVGIIKANPDQSKHLETATMNLGDIGWVDFVNLRAETYSEEHRIPEVVFGTPLQDAERRDFTINSLFYNISEKKIEDFTGMGVDDLKNQLIRTPLDPRVTFLDDPLRILRAVRFASRFNFRLDESICTAAVLPEVKEALIKKVSRERVGKELLGMLTGSSAHPERALKLLHQLDLCKSVFLPPLEQSIFHGDGLPHDLDFQSEVWNHGYVYAAEMYQTLQERSDKPIDVNAMNDEQQNQFKLRILSSFLLPLRDHYVLVKKRQVFLPAFIIRESLKLKTRDADDVGNVILRKVNDFENVVNSPFDRVNTGLLLREIGALWEICLDVVLVKELIKLEAKVDKQTLRQKYVKFRNSIHTSGLNDVWTMKPLLNGTEIVKTLGIPPGPQIKATLDKIIVWQLRNPNSTREECMEHFKK